MEATRSRHHLGTDDRTRISGCENFCLAFIPSLEELLKWTAESVREQNAYMQARYISKAEGKWVFKDNPIRNQSDKCVSAFDTFDRVSFLNYKDHTIKSG